MPGAQMTLEAPVAAPPLVSVGLPVYNGERYLAQALESLCSLDWPELEIVVSDNASTDRTPEICREFAERFPFVRVIRQPKNRGVQNNFRAVLDAARGDYFVWAGVDDAWEPAFVRRLVAELAAHPEAVLAMSAFERVYDDGQVLDVQRFVGKDSPNGKSAFATALKLMSPLKYNLFHYGVFRASYISRAVAYFPDVPAWDRVFMTMVCLSAPVRCVDEVLHRHGVHAVSVNERYPAESVFRGKKGKDYRSLFWVTVGAIARITLRSDLIPFRRKLLLPACLACYFLETAKHRLRVLASRTLWFFKKRIIGPVLGPVRTRLKARLETLRASLEGGGGRSRPGTVRLKAEYFALFFLWNTGKSVRQVLSAVRRAVLPDRVRSAKNKRKVAAA